jgi:hypothetical protein
MGLQLNTHRPLIFFLFFFLFFQIDPKAFSGKALQRHNTFVCCIRSTTNRQFNIPTRPWYFYSQCSSPLLLALLQIGRTQGIVILHRSRKIHVNLDRYLAVRLCFCFLDFESRQQRGWAAPKVTQRQLHPHTDFTFESSSLRAFNSSSTS